jgi:NRAMP (natural resistance-associated macrophage protein)-like metal ion transporter
MAFFKNLKRYRARFLLLLAVVGPGIITANVDNDAGGIATYSVAGAHYGYSLLWMMPLVAIALVIIQEMSARLGVVTGKGLADLIREGLGVKWTTLILGMLLFVNLANTVSEFAGVAASMEIFGVSKYLSVPIAAVGVWRDLPVLCHFRIHGQTGLGIRAACIDHTFISIRSRLCDHLCYHHRHDHCPLDAVLSAIFYCR